MRVHYGRFANSTSLLDKRSRELSTSFISLRTIRLLTTSTPSNGVTKQWRVESKGISSMQAKSCTLLSELLCHDEWAYAASNGVGAIGREQSEGEKELHHSANVVYVLSEWTGEAELGKVGRTEGNLTVAELRACRLPIFSSPLTMRVIAVI